MVEKASGDKNSSEAYLEGNFRKIPFMCAINKNPRTFLEEQGFNNLFIASPFKEGSTYLLNQ